MLSNDYQICVPLLIVFEFGELNLKCIMNCDKKINFNFTPDYHKNITLKPSTSVQSMEYNFNLI